MTDFPVVFASLKPLLGQYAERLCVKADTAVEYTLVTKSAVSYIQSRILSRQGHRALQFAEQRVEVLFREVPFERLGDGLVVTLECEQALR